MNIYDGIVETQTRDQVDRFPLGHVGTVDPEGHDDLYDPLLTVHIQAEDRRTAEQYLARLDTLPADLLVTGYTGGDQWLQWAEPVESEHERCALHVTIYGGWLQAIALVEHLTGVPADNARATYSSATDWANQPQSLTYERDRGRRWYPAQHAAVAVLTGQTAADQAERAADAAWRQSGQPVENRDAYMAGYTSGREDGWDAAQESAAQAF